ncbi:helix-turn-helix domain-containing protein [Butyrivibrio sp. AE3006]|uniref:helix-turn-helix domain-containing protein n=1 Tax=Butyrivibrio sp. AE3006 TaxID=1280673 RepID=UPI0003F4BB71|nr:helix-turn-helix transcriptional regulator [Butyrivibrio sp. AE3006]
MDLVKIGRYIAGKRKELGMTQKQLAEKLGMSDKSVSKWERGVCLPDVSVYSELCGVLGISINEFIAGEDLSQETIVQKSEENIMGVATDSKNKQKFLKRTICVLLIVSILALSIIGVIIYKALKPRNFIEPLTF